jgi:hypothetical protein
MSPPLPAVGTSRIRQTRHSSSLSAAILRIWRRNRRACQGALACWAWYLAENRAASGSRTFNGSSPRAPPYQLAARGPHNQVQRDKRSGTDLLSEVGELLPGGAMPRRLLQDLQRLIVPRRTKGVTHKLDLAAARTRPERLKGPPEQGSHCRRYSASCSRTKNARSRGSRCSSRTNSVLIAATFPIRAFSDPS